MKKQLVVNWHILEACNFGCRYCFAHWPAGEAPAEIWKHAEKWQKTLSEIRQLPSHVPGDWDGIRLNLAGGEPLLLWNKGVLDNILSYAEALGFKLSIISNGYLMSDEFIAAWAPKMQIIGISMDSGDSSVNARIGRCAKSGDSPQISPSRVADIFRSSRRLNPSIECKLNTVVNAENWQEDCHSLIKNIAPDRWKVFKMLPLADTPAIVAKQYPLRISDAQFAAFLERHDDLRHIMTPEDNDAMTESYLMIDPLGRFYQNASAGSGYAHVVSDPVHQAGVAKAIGQVMFDKAKFNRRYIPVYNDSAHGC